MWEHYRSTNLAYSKKATYKFPSGFSFIAFLRLLPKKVAKMHTDFVTGRCFVHPPLIFATYSLIISLQHISFVLVCLVKVCEHSALTSVMKDPPLIVSYFAEVVKKTLIS